MFYCKNCGLEFENPKRHYETHSVSSPHELIFICPACKSEKIFEKVLTHCKLCGVKLSVGEKDYCSNKCRKKDNDLTFKKKPALKIDTTLNDIIKGLENYNKLNNKNLSYGKYVAFILPKEKKKCKKRKTT